jgi:3-deoxy-D-manno-octulosonic-acid transferase
VFVLYRFIVALLFYGSLPLLLLFVMATGKHRQGLSERFGFFRLRQHGNDAAGQTVWLHAASIGEVQAAKSIIIELKKRLPSARIVLSVMTLHGKQFAEKQLDSSIACILAPLDVPGIVGRAINTIRPDVYICIETELWPVLLDSLFRRKVRLCLVNGRISQKSYGSYHKMRRLIRHTTCQFDKIAVISEEDRTRYLSLGAKPKSLAVEGNVKYDLSLPENSEQIVEQYRELFNIEDEDVFVAGSTHGDEEIQLSRLFDSFQHENAMVILIAPRHTQRLDEIITKFQGHAIEFQLLSNLKNGTESRHSKVVLIDTMGELSLLYGLADYIFCGGSLVDKGGHNLMEAAVWNKAVFYGPHIEDFHDAAQLLESVSGGFPVTNIDDLENLLHFYRAHPDEYDQACQRAGEIARQQQGSSARQLAFVLDM